MALELSSPWIQLALAATLLGFPLYLGLLQPRLRSSRLLLAGDHAWFGSFWGSVLPVMWLVSLVVVAGVAASGVPLTAIGLVQPPAWAPAATAVVAPVLALAAIRRAPAADAPAPSS